MILFFPDFLSFRRAQESHRRTRLVNILREKQAVPYRKREELLIFSSR
jgi:hypothetical protein